MRPPACEQQDDKQSGSVLVFALLATVALLGIGLATMFRSSTGNRVSGNVIRRHEALNAAEMGIDRARSLLGQSNDWNTFLGAVGGASCCQGAAPCGVDDKHPRKGNIFCNGTVALWNTSVVPSTSQTAQTDMGIDGVKYTVWIRNDDLEIGSSPYVDTDKQVILYAEGVARDGVSLVGIEAVVAEVN